TCAIPIWAQGALPAARLLADGRGAQRPAAEAGDPALPRDGARHGGRLPARGGGGRAPARARTRRRTARPASRTAPSPACAQGALPGRARQRTLGGRPLLRAAAARAGVGLRPRVVDL